MPKKRGVERIYPNYLADARVEPVVGVKVGEVKVRLEKGFGKGREDGGAKKVNSSFAGGHLQVGGNLQSKS